jgi:TetR/AcrR family transcriptional regulator, transcriptional repressor for nem operon
MKGAGLTQGLLQAVRVKGGPGGTGVKAGLGERLQPMVAATAANPKDPLGAVMAFYLCRGHAAYRVHASITSKRFASSCPR